MQFCRVLLVWTCILGAVTAGAAERYGMIIGARAGNQSLFDENSRYILQTAKLLQQAGITQIKIFAEGGSKLDPGAQSPGAEEIAAELSRLATTLRADDELWLFIFGYANASGTKVSLATDGRRMHGQELAARLKAIPARKTIFCLTLQSWALAEQLQDKNATVISAASAPGQLNPPLLTNYLLTLWQSQPNKPLNELLQAAAQEVNTYFSRNNLAAGESAAVLTEGKVIGFPFAVKLPELKPVSDPATAAAPASVRPLTAKVQIQAATPETRSLIAAAAAAAKDNAGFSRMALRLESECTINSDSTMKYTEHNFIYVIDEGGVGHYSRLVYQDMPPALEFRLILARVIYPDGTFAEALVDRLAGKNGGNLYSLKLPGLAPGCLIEFHAERNYQQEANIPFFEKGFVVQREMPVASYALTVRYPRNFKLQTRVVNGKPAAEERGTQGYSNTVTYRFDRIPAYEPLRFDPPGDEILTKILISYASSWNEFANWAKAMLEGTDRLDDRTIELTKRLCAGAATDTAKVRAIYEFLCNLRYDTTPVGARAFRPRLPGEVCSEGYGDCKDKANALVTMAAAVGVKGYLALVKRGGRVQSDFPSWQFNHAVAYFPQLTGYPAGLWCDPTDTATVFGTLPPGDVGCDAWLADGRNSTFKKITPPDGRDNMLRQDMVFQVTPDQRFTGKVTFTATGLQDYQLRSKFSRFTPQQKLQAVQEFVNQGSRGIRVLSLVHTPVNDLATPFAVTLTIKGPSWPLTARNLEMPVDLWGPFSQAGRDRPVYLNDGQSLQLVQTIKVIGDRLNGRGQWQQDSDGLTLRCDYDADGSGRYCEARFADGVFSVTEFDRVAPLIAEWYAKMN